MRLHKAKELIIKAASNDLGFDLSSNIVVKPYLVVGVKLGNITPEQAAKKTINDYTEDCTRIFTKAEA